MQIYVFFVITPNIFSIILSCMPHYPPNQKPSFIYLYINKLRINLPFEVFFGKCAEKPEA